MSSFLVSPETINRIVTFLDLHASNDRIENHGIKRLVERYGYDVGAHDFTEKMARDLLELNLAALDQRYRPGTGKHDLDYMTSKGARFEYQFKPSPPVQVLKSVECLGYQCAEGDIPTRPLYKFLEELEAQIARFISHTLAGYDKAEWG